MTNMCAPIRGKIDLKNSPRIRFNDDHATIFRKNNTTTGTHCVQRKTFRFWLILRRCIMSVFCLFCIYILYCAYTQECSKSFVSYTNVEYCMYYSFVGIICEIFKSCFFLVWVACEIVNFSFEEGLSYFIRHVTKCFWTLHIYTRS